jgi:HrpA-like RNA helicase
VDAARSDVLAALAHHSVVVFKGDTGCGKSSRVPRFLVEADAAARVVVAQPRRVAAIALARRVAAERGESVGGAKGLVGYRVGHATKTGPHTRLTFATVGWLLQKLVHFVANDASSSSSAKGTPFEYSVVVVDEVRTRGTRGDREAGGL